MPGQTIPSYRRDIDGLRAIAILLVVAFHARLPGVQGGYIGVDVFFVISGFLITSLIVEEALATGRIHLQSFYARRVRRLFPALFVVVLATLVLAWVFLLPTRDEQQDVARSAIAASTYVANIYFLLTSGRYFDTASELKPLLHTWSLSVEEQFYLFWPMLVVAVLWMCRRRQIGIHKWLTVAYASVLLASFVSSVSMLESHPRAVFYSMPTRAWEFAAGGLLALWLPRLAKSTHPVGDALSLAGIAMILAGAVYFDATTAIPGLPALVPVAGACLVIAGGSMNRSGVVYRLLSFGPVAYIGLLSYSWYLWHWPLLSIARARTLQEPHMLRDVAIALAALGAAHLTYQWVENPIRTQRPWLFRASRTTIAAGAALTLAAVAVAVGLRASAISTASKGVTHGRPLTVSAGSGSRPICRQVPPFSEPVSRSLCTIGEASEPIKAVVWGDSHADQYFPMIRKFVASQSDVAILQRTFMGCTPLGAPGPSANTADADKDACREYNAAVLKEITELSGAGLQGVVLSGRWLDDFGAGRVSAARLSQPDREISGEEQSRKMWGSAQELSQLLERFHELGLKTLVIAPLGEMRYDVPKCLARRGPKACSVKRDVVERQRYSTLLAMRDVVSRFPEAALLDPIDVLCDADRCFSQRDGVALYADDNHLSAPAAELLLSSAYDDLVWLTEGGKRLAANQVYGSSTRPRLSMLRGSSMRLSLRMTSISAAERENGR